MPAHAHQQNVEQDVLECLDKFLSSTNRHARIDTSVVVLSDLVVQFERRAKKEVAYTLQHMPAAKCRPTHVFFCEDPTYGAFALRSDRYDYIILHIGIVPAIIDFCMRMMANPELWENIGAPATTTDDPARTAFATIFMSECLGFIVRHELAHLVLGHCEFVAPKGEAATIADTDGRLPAGADAITIQALEVAADGHSAIWGAVRLPLFLTARSGEEGRSDSRNRHRGYY